MEVSLKDKVAIVTGANQGLGLEIARKMVLAGATTVICARDRLLLERAKDYLANQAIDTTVEAIPTDVTVAEQVDNLVKHTFDSFGRIDILVNNAGVYGPMGVIEDVDFNKWMRAVAINLYGAVLMCRAVLPIMKKQRSGKIIQMGGGGAANPMPYISAYAASKAAVVRFTESLALEVLEYGIDINSIAPGALNTRMLEEVLDAGPEKVGEDFYKRSLKQKESGGVSLDYAATLAVFLASDESNGITGKLISALWDDWEHWTDHLGDLQSSDVYTLRRIAGRDRGLKWGDK